MFFSDPVAKKYYTVAVPFLTVMCLLATAQAQDFERIQLSNAFYSEGGAAGDFDKDGQGDVVVGPWIYWGGDFSEKSRFYPGDALDPVGYSANFLMFTGDANSDGNQDIYVIGFPGQESWWYENPGNPRATDNWTQHTILSVVDNESPLIADIDGDGLDDLICSSQGHYGYATHAELNVNEPWRFVRISPNNGYQRFTHGLGAGDVNNDGHLDLLEKDGWWQNPGVVAKVEDENAYWDFHPFTFSTGGSQMITADLDGDGKSEIITGLAAHGYGLVYYRATNDAATEFEKHEIMTDSSETSPTGLAVSQLHAVAVADINLDGVPDIITGKRWWAHANGDPGNMEPATLLWFETQRRGDRIQFLPHVVDNSSGVGTQITATDVNLDGLPDMVAGTKRGAHVFLQRPRDLTPGDFLVPSQAANDEFQQHAALDWHSTSDGDGVPAIGDRPLNFSFNEPSLLDWEVRGPISQTLLMEGVLNTGSSTPDSIGEVISRPFLLSKPIMQADVAGPANEQVRLELIAESTGKSIASAIGTGTIELKSIELDASTAVGELVRLRIVDHAKDSFLKCDNIRFRDK